MPKHPSGYTITVRRQRAIELADQVLLDALRGEGWVNGQRIAAKAGWSFRSAVSTLSRLVKAGRVESQWVMQRKTTVAGNPNVYQVREYRVRGAIGVPSMVEQVGALRRAVSLTRLQPSIKRPPPCLMCGERGEHHPDCQLQT